MIDLLKQCLLGVKLLFWYTRCGIIVTQQRLRLQELVLKEELRSSEGTKLL